MTSDFYAEDEERDVIKMMGDSLQMMKESLDEMRNLLYAELEGRKARDDRGIAFAEFQTKLQAGDLGRAEGTREKELVKRGARTVPKIILNPGTESALAGSEQMVVCGVCEQKHSRDQLIGMTAKMYGMLDAGDVVPAGLCPRCRSFVYLPELENEPNLPGFIEIDRPIKTARHWLNENSVVRDTENGTRWVLLIPPGRRGAEEFAAAAQEWDVTQEVVRALRDENNEVVGVFYDE